MKGNTLREQSLKLKPDAAERELVKAARRLTRLQAIRRGLAKRMRQTDEAIRAARRELKLLVHDVAGGDPFDQMPPLREFGETQADK